MALFEIVSRYGVALVFANVLGEQLGLPVPAVPTLIVAGALAAQGALSGPRVLVVAVAACLAADFVWYLLGRAQGYRVLRTLCRVSLSPDSCVQQTESFFQRYGLTSLLFAKFVPGFSTVAPPLAGAARARIVSFLAWDAAGSLLWAGSAIALGAVFHEAVDRVLDGLSSIGSGAIVVLGVGLALFVAWKYNQRRRFYQALRMARISPEELHRAIERGEAPVVVDVRSDAARRADPRRIPGARLLEFPSLETGLRDLPADREIVLYCT
ncbi:MAG: VTT domain-containing protein [Acidobacteriota bacterium]